MLCVQSSRVSAPGYSPGSRPAGQPSPISPLSSKDVLPPNFHTPKFGEYDNSTHLKILSPFIKATFRLLITLKIIENNKNC